jgi:RHS repeat-associated protein
VALRIAYAGGTSNLLYLTTDHLGTPVLTTDEAGAQVWAGGFEPFGSAYDLVQNTEMFLRFPGQWWDGSFGGYAFRDETYYNVHRWYGVGTGRYGRPDPLRQHGDPHLYIYGRANPTFFADPLGLKVLLCERPNEIPEFDDVPVLDDLPHKWFKTDTTEAGLGEAGGGMPGNELPGCRCQYTEIIDHTGESEKPNSTCRELSRVDEECVNNELVIGRPQGAWTPGFNDCWSFVNRVIQKCRLGRPLNPAMPGYRQSPL